MSEETKTPTLTVLIPPEQAPSHALLGAIRRVAGPLLLVVQPEGFKHMSDLELKSLLKEARALNPDRRLIIATKDKRILGCAKTAGWEGMSTLRELKPLLKGHPSAAEGLRNFSPVSWRQDIRTRLQSVGLLSLPRLRIWLLLGLSVLAFLFVFFRLLPSAEVQIWPNQETNNFTTNVYFVHSGAVLPVPTDRVKVLPMLQLTVRLTKSLTYDQISKSFTGKNAGMTVTVLNDSEERISLREGTRLTNQAGMRFRLQSDVIMEAKAKQNVLAIADPIDQYGEVLGERGNVPANVKWDFPGLSEQERKVIYARNEKPATGGSTSYVSIIKKEDIFGDKQQAGAKQQLEQELLSAAKQEVDEEIVSRNVFSNAHYVQLTFTYADLSKVVYKNFDLSEQFIGQSSTSIPIQGDIEYTVLLYNQDELLGLLKKEVKSRAPAEKMVVPASLMRENMDLQVIPPWDDDLRWMKITADLTYNQRYILSPITPTGAKFGKYIRDNVAGKTVTEAYRIIKNLPEVSRTEISVWPPWAFTLPTLGTNISIEEMEE